MNKYYDVIDNILSLSDTIYEGIEYMRKQIQELRYEEALVLLQDSLLGIISIQDAIKPMESKLEENKIGDLTMKLIINMEYIVNAYELKQEYNLENRINEGIIPACFLWKKELEMTLKPYLVS